MEHIKTITMKVYYSNILDHLDNAVTKTVYCVSAKQAWYLGNQFVNNCPPAMTHKVTIKFIDLREAVDLLNGERQ